MAELNKWRTPVVLQELETGKAVDQERRISRKAEKRVLLR
jgi:hypothetical protein